MRRLAYFTLFIPLIIAVSVYESQAEETYLGDFCWQLNDIESAGTLKIGLYLKDGYHIAVYGALSGDIDGVTVRYPVNGNAEIDGNNVLMTIVAAYSGSEAEIYHITLSLSGLNGTYDTVSMSKGDEQTAGTSGGTVTSIACQ